MGWLFARDPLGASEQALPYVRERLRHWPDTARWLELGDATDPRLVPRDPRQLGLARVLLLSSPAGALDRAGHAGLGDLAASVSSGATGPLELVGFTLEDNSDPGIVSALAGALRFDEMYAYAFGALSDGDWLDPLEVSGASPEERAKVTSMSGGRVEAFRRELTAIRPEADRVTRAVAAELIERARRERVCRIEVDRGACEGGALALLRESDIPYVQVVRGRGY